jgi:DMSO/TMAO reductase YedYZ molybdopterin-dependent catalytic subunit
VVTPSSVATQQSINGIKNIKRIGTIRFTDARPTDGWAEQGYDWYAGLRYEIKQSGRGVGARRHDRCRLCGSHRQIGRRRRGFVAI